MLPSFNLRLIFLKISFESYFEFFVGFLISFKFNYMLVFKFICAIFEIN